MVSYLPNVISQCLYSVKYLGTEGCDILDKIHPFLKDVLYHFHNIFSWQKK
jgi:hypothetical protein